MTPSPHLFGQCLVTGANRGLGLEFARQLLQAGNRVVATCRNPARAGALNRLSAQFPGRLHVLPLDVASARSREELRHELPLVLEAVRLDLLLNNAGVLQPGERFGQVSQEHLETSLRTNAIGPFLLAQMLAPLLADGSGDRRGAVVANISSEIGSLAGRREFRTPSYAIGKAALNMATVQLAHALAPRGIVVAAFHPGWVRTDMGGEQAPLAAAEAASALLDRFSALETVHNGAFLDREGRSLPW